MKRRCFHRKFFATHRFSLKLRNGTIIAVRIGLPNKKWGVPASSGSYGQKCDVVWSVFVCLMTWFWNNVWVGVPYGLENVQPQLRVSAAFIDGGVLPCAAISIWCQSSDGLSSTVKDWDGLESGGHCHSMTATVRRRVLLFVLFVVVGNTEFAV
jgi:hypothetical protein